MISACATFLAFVVVGQVEPHEKPSSSAKKQAADPWHAIYRTDAAEYKFYRDAPKKEMLELRPQPVYAWVNPTRDDGQTGDVFLWTYRGRPEAVGSIFSHPWRGERRVIHEFHSLSPVILYPEGNPRMRWQPKSGAVLRALSDAPKVAESRPQRLLQLKALSREFSAYSVNPASGDRWELRLQTAPLLQYDAAGPEVLGGALFTFVTTAGTDPELMLLIEARKTDQGWQWMFTPARFSDYKLYLLHKGRQVWAGLREPQDLLESDGRHFYFDAQHLYYARVDRIIPDVERGE